MSASRERTASTEKRSDKEPNRGACGKHPEDGFRSGEFMRKRVRPIPEKKEGGLHPWRYGSGSTQVRDRAGSFTGAVGGDVCPVACQALAGTWI